MSSPNEKLELSRELLITRTKYIFDQLIHYGVFRSYLEQTNNTDDFSKNNVKALKEMKENILIDFFNLEKNLLEVHIFEKKENSLQYTGNREVLVFYELLISNFEVLRRNIAQVFSTKFYLVNKNNQKYLTMEQRREEYHKAIALLR